MTSLAEIGLVTSIVLSFTLNVAVADPALMQPVEDIHFQELPPPWLISGESGVSGSKVKTVVPASSRPVVKQAPKSVARAPEANTPKSISAQSPVQSIINAANKGDKNAQYDLGMRYQYGNGVKKESY